MKIAKFYTRGSIFTRESLVNLDEKGYMQFINEASANVMLLARGGDWPATK
jgi:hypothetical protein